MQRSGNASASSGSCAAPSNFERVQATVRRMNEVQLTEFLLETVDKDRLSRIATRIMAHAHSVNLSEVAQASRKLVAKSGLAKRATAKSPIRQRRNSRQKHTTRATAAAERSRSSPDVAETSTTPKKQAVTYFVVRTTRPREPGEYPPNSQPSETSVKPAARNISAPPKAGRARPTFDCTECPYSSVDRRGINNHRKAHGRVADYKCQYCTYASTGSAVAQHMKVHGEMEQKPARIRLVSPTVKAAPEITPAPSVRGRSPTPAPRSKRKQTAPGRPGEKRKLLYCEYPHCNVVVDKEEVLETHVSLHHRAPEIDEPSSSISPFETKKCSAAPRTRQTAVVMPQAAVPAPDGNMSAGAIGVGPNTEHTPARIRIISSPEQSSVTTFDVGNMGNQRDAIRRGNMVPFRVRQRNPRPKTSYGSRRARERLQRPSDPSIPMDCVQCGYHAKNWRSLIGHRGQKHKQPQARSDGAAEPSGEPAQPEAYLQESSEESYSIAALVPAAVRAALSTSQSTTPPTPAATVQSMVQATVHAMVSSTGLPAAPATALLTAQSTALPAVLSTVPPTIPPVGFPGDGDVASGSASKTLQSVSVPARARSVERPTFRDYPQPGVIRFVGSAAHGNDGSFSEVSDTDWEDVESVASLGSPRKPRYSYGRSHTSFGPRSFHYARREAVTELITEVALTEAAVMSGGRGAEPEVEGAGNASGVTVE